MYEKEIPGGKLGRRVLDQPRIAAKLDGISSIHATEEQWLLEDQQD